jgi:signal transduction histidine kinase
MGPAAPGLSAVDDQTLIEKVVAVSEPLGALLAERLARLAELERSFAGALETAKLDALKEFAYGASHEINNPLANISARAQTLLQDERDPERRRRLAAINAQAFRAHEMIADVMLFARPPRMERRAVDLAGLVASLLDELSEPAAAQHTQFLWNPPAEPILASVDPVHLRVALKALVANALEAMAEGGRIEIVIRRGMSPGTHSATTSANDSVEIVISDSGTGIPDHVRSHIFDPFFSGREAGRGLGMGLPKCWRIVREHGGQIHVESPAGRGATFKIVLPASFQ